MPIHATEKALADSQKAPADARRSAAEITVLAESQKR